MVVPLDVGAEELSAYVCVKGCFDAGRRRQTLRETNSIEPAVELLDPCNLLSDKLDLLVDIPILFCIALVSGQMGTGGYENARSLHDDPPRGLL
jgi:hypothetical protein